MVAALGVVLTVIPGIIMVIGSVLTAIKRKDPFIKYRNFPLLLIQNVGVMLSAIITSVYMALRPNYSCYLYYFGALSVFAGMAYPQFIRYWQYCVNFHVAKVRAKFRSDQMIPDWGKTSWFFRNRWVASPSILYKVFVVGFWVWLIPIVPYPIIYGEYTYNLETGGCRVYPAGIYMIPVFAFMFFIVGGFCAYVTWESQDAYHIKEECRYVIMWWIVCLVIWMPYQIAAPGHVQQQVSPSLWILLGLYGTFLLSNFYPLILIHFEKNRTQLIPTSEFKDFATQLDDVIFRNAFLDYLALTWQQENILFYQAVVDWKRMSLNASNRADVAKFIHDNYILESGICQVNISGPQRTKISNTVETGEAPPQDLYDEALTSVLNMVHSQSYYPFKASKLYKNAKA